MRASCLPVIAAVLASLGSGCGGKKTIARPYPEPDGQPILDALAAIEDRVLSYQARAVMDYRAHEKNARGPVKLLGRVGTRLRVRAYDPSGTQPVADMACDGIEYRFVDHAQSCSLTGVCSRDTIAQFLLLSIDPDDLLLFAVGSTPIIPNAVINVTWDDVNGREVLTLMARDSTRSQIIEVSGRHCPKREPGSEECPWELVSSVLRDAYGNEVWRIDSEDFYAVRSRDGNIYRIPRKSQIRQPLTDTTVSIEWGERVFNPDYKSEHFDLTVPAGLGTCSVTIPGNTSTSVSREE